MNKDITLEEYTIKVNTILADKKGREFTKEELTPLWKSLQNDDIDPNFYDDEIYEEAKNDFLTKYARSLKISDNAEQEYNQHRLEKYRDNL